jgi:hypothetical protein
VVFADQAPEDLPALDPGGDVDGAAGLPQRGFLLSALMRTMAVIVPRVLCKHPSQVLLTEDQHVVQALTAKRSDEPLGE